MLGVSGLIHAYKMATQMAFQAAAIVEKNIEKMLYLRCDYPHLNDALRIAKNHHANIIAQDLQLDCRLTVRVPLADFQAAVNAWQFERTIDLREEPF